MTTPKRIRAALPTAISLALCGLSLTAAGAAAAAPVVTGAPKEALVEFEALMGIPAEGYSLACTNLPGCATGGKVDLVTAASVRVAYQGDSRSTRGVGPLRYLLHHGTVARTIACQGLAEPYTSTMKTVGTKTGELAVTEVRSVPGTNTLAVALNPGGDSGAEFPGEIVERSDGGCGAPPAEPVRLDMGLWHYNFFFAHRGEQPEGSNDLLFEGLAWNAGRFFKEYNRTVDVALGTSTYPVQERTRIEVTPRYCDGRRNRIASATAGGQSLGLDGMSTYPGQVITVPQKSKFRFQDGSIVELDKGGSFQVERCTEDGSTIYLPQSVGKFWAEVKKFLSGAEAKFEVKTDRAVAGVRGTAYELNYNKRKQLTRVRVKEGSVSLKGINGAKGKILIKAGQVGIQKGKQRPQIVKR